MSKRRRQPNGRPTIYPGADGLHHCWVTVGTKPDGTPHRKHVKRRTAEAVATAVDQLLDQVRRNGTVPAGPVDTVADWLRYYLTNIVKPNKAWGTWRSYSSICELHVIPAIGQRRLRGHRNVLETEHIEQMYATMRAKGLRSTYIRQVHRVLSRALKVAERRGRASRNVCAMMDGPKARTQRIQGYELADAQAILREAVNDPQAARWLLGMVLGPRQGEALGLRWPHVRLDADPPTIKIVRQIQRRTWEHGCDDPVACARPHCRARRCPPKYEHGCMDACEKLAHRCPRRRQVPGCSRHTRACPAPCPAGCTDHARVCPQRKGGGLVESDVKSERGERTLHPSAPIVTLLTRLREDAIRRHDGIWPGDGYVFVDERGGPIDPRRDHAAWEALLKRAGVPDGRLHAARHTAASMLSATGTKIEEVQDILGHTDIRTTRGYVDVAADLKRQAVERVTEALLDGDLRALLQPLAATVKPTG